MVRAPNLESVTFQECGLSNATMIDIARVLPEWPITALDLYHTVMDNTGAEAMGNALKKNTTLKVLRLDHGLCGGQMAFDGAHLLRAIGPDSALQTLVFQGRVIENLK
jgi:hypothetical protein